VFHIAIKTQGTSATTTVIINRFRSSASRTCAAPAVVFPGVYRKVSGASYRG